MAAVDTRAPSGGPDSAILDNIPASLLHPSMGLTLVKNVKKLASSTSFWELPAYESCMTLSYGGVIDDAATVAELEVPVSSAPVVVEKPAGKRAPPKRKLPPKKGDFDISSFINIGGMLESVDVLGPFATDEDNKSSVFIITSRRPPTPLNSSTDEAQSGHLVVYEIPFEHVPIEESGNKPLCKLILKKPRLSRISPLKSGICVGIEWLNPLLFGEFLPSKRGDPLVLLLMDNGSISLCKFDVSVLRRDVRDGAVVEDSYTELWEHDPTVEIPDQFITCMAVSYGTEKYKQPVDNDSLGSKDGRSSTYRHIVTICGGTSDGYLHMWRFYWDDLCEASSLISLCDGNSVYPFFSQSTPIFVDPKDTRPTRRLTALRFLPCPESFILSIATYLGTVIIWDTRNSYLEGELTSYHNSHRPLTSICFSGTQQHLLIGGSSVVSVEWQCKPGLTQLPYDRNPQIAYKGLMDNVCWCMDSTEHSSYFVYDDGLFVQVPANAIGRRNTYDLTTTYLWEPSTVDGFDQVASAPSVPIRDVVSHAADLAEGQFQLDLSFIRDNGIWITRNGSKFRGPRSDDIQAQRLLRCKVLAHHTVKSRILPIVAYCT
ncbi:uncharacterized protein BXIN_0138 [Babesia sp. Xinjiang]|uniref:uncharacterized protein n=1 Tax=Babesia sp. Xinjiang TaxID=462227 RepID=UPI000A248662|nr:uncharacterized protein BXIN_0138 [Babesia sp. Xinjiang]ORM39718.1 hypothetical protein BXIN_0138 [Babesia sp. Xinjiang]